MLSSTKLNLLPADLWFLVNQAKLKGIQPRFHGNEFTQLYIGPYQRVHVWHEDMKCPQNNSKIHDHMWTMHSQVFSGCIHQRTYELLPGADMAMYDVSAGEKKAEFDFVKRCNAKVSGIYEVGPGKNYYFAEGQFHETNAIHGTVTVITKSVDILRTPRIICPKDEQPFDAFDNPFNADKDELWRVIYEALDNI